MYISRHNKKENCDENIVYIIPVKPVIIFSRIILHNNIANVEYTRIGRPYALSIMSYYLIIIFKDYVNWHNKNDVPLLVFLITML